MAYTVTELRESRTLSVGQQEQAELVFRVVESPAQTDPANIDERAVIDAVITGSSPAAPAEFEDLPQLSARVRPVNGRDEWRVTVTYGLPQGGFGGNSDGSYRVEFTGGTSNELIQVGLSETVYDGESVGGLINVTSQGVEGLQIEEEDYAWTETWIRTGAQATWANQIAISQLRKRVNDAAFRGFAAGEVFFDDFTASPRSQAEWEYRFRFRARPNRTDITVGTGTYSITGIDKGGWEYLWVSYREETTSSGQLISVPVSAYVNKVYRTADFSSLGIGTAALY